MTEAHCQLEQVTFVLGGARSGKSAFAEQLAAQCGERVIYLASAQARDEEMRDRVRQHQLRRPTSWLTVEAPFNPADAVARELQKGGVDAVLMDCLSILTSNILLMLPENCSELTGWNAVADLLEQLFKVIASYPEVRWILVSNEVGQGIVPTYSLGRLYRDVLGRVNQYAASRAREAYWLMAGIPLKIKG